LTTELFSIVFDFYLLGLFWGLYFIIYFLLFVFAKFSQLTF
jgi:hypothetical protein